MEYKVMVVDDSVMMRSVIRTFVAKMPEFRAVAFAENGKKALEELDKHKDLAIILLDIEMPEMDGLEFLRFAKLKSKAKIIILSSVALAGSPHAAKARALGADAIVSKPSGAVSLDLVDARGTELTQVMRRLVGLP
ncbi:MAG: response regulator [Methylovulum sp.]|jgi:two-component system chemotaxis response regulator CheB|nr:response regulator [Methylovulum sp.]TSA38057.1 MAG: response regulator [Methylococcaceae bacterium]